MKLHRAQRAAKLARQKVDEARQLVSEAQQWAKEESAKHTPVHTPTQSPRRLSRQGSRGRESVRGGRMVEELVQSSLQAARWNQSVEAVRRANLVNAASCRTRPLPVPLRIKLAKTCLHPLCPYLTHSDSNVCQGYCCLTCGGTPKTSVPIHGACCEHRQLFGNACQPHSPRSPATEDRSEVSAVMMSA